MYHNRHLKDAQAEGGRMIDSMDLERMEDSLRSLEATVETVVSQQLNELQTLGAIHECLKELIELIKAK